jgi:hypothetical protein
MFDVAPRALVAHQQMQDLVLVALISQQPDAEAVLQRFRTLVRDLTADEPTLADDDTFVAAVQRSAARFDRLVQLVMPAIARQALTDGGSRRLPAPRDEQD